MNRVQRITKWEKTIAAIVADYKALDAACDAAENAGTLNPEGPLFTAIWKAFDGLLNLVDLEGWIAWYIFDNQCGKNRLAAKGPEGKTKPISTPRQLARLIVDTEDANQ